MMKKKIICLALMLFFAAAGYCVEQTVKVEVRPYKISAKPGEVFNVTARVVNTGLDAKHFEASGDSSDWTTDNKAVEIRNANMTGQNTMKVVFSPGSSREDTLALVVPDKGNTEPITFKLNFKPLEAWSDSITVNTGHKKESK